VPIGRPESLDGKKSLAVKYTRNSSGDEIANVNATTSCTYYKIQ